MVNIQKLISKFMIIDWSDNMRIQNLQEIKIEIESQLAWIYNEGIPEIEELIEEDDRYIELRYEIKNKEEFLTGFKNFINNQINIWQN